MQKHLVISKKSCNFARFFAYSMVWYIVVERENEGENMGNKLEIN